jgi:hypothetical protein
MVMLSFLMPICLTVQEHFETDWAPAREAVRIPGQKVHAVPTVDLKVPVSHAVHVPCVPLFPGPHVATHDTPISSPPNRPGS